MSWGFLRQVVTDAAIQKAVFVLAGELSRIEPGSGCGAPLASPSSVIVGTVTRGPAAAVKKNHGRASCRTEFGVSDVQDTGVDLLQCAE